MEIVLLTPTTIKIKGKQISFIVDPTISKAKLTADATIFLTQNEKNATPVDESRIIFHGAGEYEVGGTKVAGIMSSGELGYFVVIDGITMLLATATFLKGKEHVKDTNIIVVHTNDIVESSLFASYSPQSVLLYGPQAKEAISALGKEPVTTTKYTVTRDKLPSEMEIILLQ